MIYKEQRYKLLIDDYINRPILPAPFIILSFISRITLVMFELCEKKLSKKYKKVKDYADLEKGSSKFAFEDKKNLKENEPQLAEWSRKMASSFFSEYIKKWK